MIHTAHRAPGLAVVVAVVAAAVLLAAPALAQSPTFPPVGTSSAQAIAANPARKRIEFLNSSDTAKVAVCPTISRTGAPIICTVNGPGSITLLPYQSYRVDDVGAGTGWNVIASSDSAAMTIFEWQ